MDLQEQLCDWGNIRLAHQNASRGKRGRGATAAFEMLLADNLLELQRGLSEQTYQPGKYTSFHIHEPKKRLISAAPFRDRVVHHALCNVTVPYFERLFIPDSYANQKGKGTHRALDRCTRFARRYKYVLQCDVRQFFPSIAPLRDNSFYIFFFLAGFTFDAGFLAAGFVFLAGALIFDTTFPFGGDVFFPPFFSSATNFSTVQPTL